MKLVGSIDPPELAAQYPVSHPYASGKTHNAVVVGAGVDSNVDLVTTGYEWLTIETRMTAGANTDLVASVRAYEDDGTTLFDVALPTDAAVASALATGVDRAFARYRLGGIDKVQVRVHNANAGGQTATNVYQLQK